MQAQVVVVESDASRIATINSRLVQPLDTEILRLLPEYGSALIFSG